MIPRTRNSGRMKLSGPSKWIDSSETGWPGSCRHAMSPGRSSSASAAAAGRLRDSNGGRSERDARCHPPQAQSGRSCHQERRPCTGEETPTRRFGVHRLGIGHGRRVGQQRRGCGVGAPSARSGRGKGRTTAGPNRLMPRSPRSTLQDRSTGKTGRLGLRTIEGVRPPPAGSSRLPREPSARFSRPTSERNPGSRRRSVTNQKCVAVSASREPSEVVVEQM